MTPRKVVALAEGTNAALQQFGTDVERGLAATPKHLPSVYFYDAAGWQIWQRIKDLPEYYLNRAETDIFNQYSRVMAAQIAPGSVEVIELGAGFSEKTFEFLSALADRQVCYRPIDVNVDAIERMREEVAKRFPQFSYDGIVGTYETGLRALRSHALHEGVTRVFLFLGSNIGNMPSQEERQRVIDIRLLMQGGDRLIVGFDRFKPLGIMQAAYDDSQGVTAEFNLNLLRRINRELGGTFDTSAFVHHAYYSPQMKAMVSWLIATKPQTVKLTKVSETLEFTIKTGEGIWMEVSRKYTDDDIKELGKYTSLDVRRSFTDLDKLFSVVMFEPR